MRQLYALCPPFLVFRKLARVQAIAKTSLHNKTTRIPDSKSPLREETKTERFYLGFVHLCASGKMNPIAKYPGFVSNPENMP